VFLVPHTHWDREWYRPFQSFRISLVGVVDEALELLETDSRMRFTLDGQLATVDDYIEIRPEGEERIRALVLDGRLAIGPWLTLMDEFLVGGESIFRDLETGLARAEELGGAMRIGYLPDQFGHVAQMPQILRAFGIDQAVVWRGVPEAIDSHVFEWEAPDGSVVRAEYLPEGYGNAADLQFDSLAERMRPWFGDDPVLGMVGTDHMPPVRDLPDRAPANARIGTLGDYFAEAPKQQTVTRWRGELRSAARANLLPNVVSTRIDVKQACARAERSLERYAEPLQALYGEEWPEELLRVAWRRVLENAAHDSICACSADEVSVQVLVRYAEAEQIGLELARRAIPAGDAAVFVNPSPFERTEVVELEDGLHVVTVPPLGYTNQVAQRHKELALLDVDVRRLTRIVRGKDVGDSYNYAPPPDDVLVDEPDDERFETIEDGPLRTILVHHRAYRWDEHVVPTTTRYELRAGEQFVRVRIELDNLCSDQRVRVHVPLREPAYSTHAEGQFAIVERTGNPEGGYGEEPVATYPASGFVAAGGIALLLQHVTEYELVSERELALTVLRSTGLISRSDNPYRRVNAGPELAIPAAQMHGPHTFDFAYCVDPGNALEHAERYRLPLLIVRGRAETRAGPTLTGAVLSSLRRADGSLVARIVNESDAPTTARFGETTAGLRPWEIRTLTL
jgi:Glycosyl hydrolases family 38 N-terminal domain/Alpha mannosidase middle domain/Glycosyl hydrolases family 38 C-terminal domain